MSKKKYTAQQVRDAHFARCTDQDAREQGWSPIEIIRSWCSDFLNPKALAADHTAQYKRGKATLKSASLITSKRAQTGTAEARNARASTAKRAPHSAIVSVSAGHRAFHECVCYAALKSK